jgi:uncharacterized damage-inducible protein DinB
MTDFAKTYELTRKRFDDSVLDLNHEQLNWRLHEDALSIGEMALHLAGVEIWFVAQLLGLELGEEDAKLAKCATDGSVNDLPFPYEVAEITPEKVKSALDRARQIAEPVITDPSDVIRTKELKSALGPIINGDGAFARISAHPFYHQGQVYLIRTAPGFPK